MILIDYVLSASSPDPRANVCVETGYARVVSFLPSDGVLHSCMGCHSEMSVAKAAFEALISGYGREYVHCCAQWQA